MKNCKPELSSYIFKRQWVKRALSLSAIVALTGCPVSSTSVSDTDLIAAFLVQNDNGQASSTVTFASTDLAGENTVDLVAGESIWYQLNGVSSELRNSRDGEYTASLPSDASGWYSFTLIREPDGREQIDREITKNYIYLPDPVQSFQAEPLQFGSVINLNWELDNSAPQTINGFTTQPAEDSFNAIATCDTANGTIDLAVTEGRITQQSGMSLLEIPVADHLQQVPGLSAADIAMTSCEIDVQLVRTINGTTDVSLNRRSSARGQVLQNVTVQWLGQ